MKLDSEELLLNQAPPRTATGRGWGAALGAIIVAIAAILVLYRDTALSIVGDLGQLRNLRSRLTSSFPWCCSSYGAGGEKSLPWPPAPDYLGFLLLAVLGFGWLVAAAGQVQVVQQYAMTAMVPAAVLALAGRRVAWALAFPLAFLLLAVPFGEAFLPRLMDWTADFTVGALRATGIPVYREGTFFAIPSGSWSVVEACSGLRYLIASVTVGALYAYLTYRPGGSARSSSPFRSPCRSSPTSCAPT